MKNYHLDIARPVNVSCLLLMVNVICVSGQKEIVVNEMLAERKTTYKCAYCDNVTSGSRNELENHLNLVHNVPRDNSKVSNVIEVIELA